MITDLINRDQLIDQMASQANGIKGLVFDLFGTLIDTNSLARAFPEAGIDIDIKAFSETWQSKRLQYMWMNTLMTKSINGDTRAGPAIKFQPFDKLSIRALGYTAKIHGINLTEEQTTKILESQFFLDLMPDVVPSLESAGAQKIPFAILTNGSTQNAERLLENKGVRQYFSTIFSAEQVKCYKPSPEPYYYASSELGIEPDSLVMISANLWDIAGAQNVGMKTWWINREALIDLDQIDVKADRSFPSLIEAMKYLAADRLETSAA